MQPLKLSIPGRFWDSQVYAGRLYLFHIDGSIRIFNWDRLMEEFGIGDDLKLAMHCAFAGSDFFYGTAMGRVFQDRQVREVIRAKFDRLAEMELHLTEKQLQGAMIAHRPTDLPFPHTDSRIYGYTLYVSSQRGVWEAACHKSLKYGLAARAERRWDNGVLDLAIYGNALALAAGAEGLWETRIGETRWLYDNDDSQDQWEFTPVAKRDCSKCDWAFNSVFGSSHLGNGFLAHFDVKEVKDLPNVGEMDAEQYEHKFFGRGERPFRKLQSVRDANEIFQGQGYTWAFYDKLYQAERGVIRICRYRPWADEDEEIITQLGEVRLADWKGQVVSAGVAVFGTIIECENAVVVLGSDGENQTIPGEPVRWRAFPRSRNYENHLHLIYEDRLQIWSFNHDYFVDQKEKKMGVKPYLGPRPAGR